MKSLRKKNKIIVIAFLLFTITTGCRVNFKENYKLTEILEGFNFIEIEGLYSSTKFGQMHSFYFDEKNVENNSFIITFKNDSKIEILYKKGIIKYDNCLYKIENNISKNCNNHEKKEIEQGIKIFDDYLENMKLTKEDLSITESEVKNTIINIKNR